MSNTNNQSNPTTTTQLAAVRNEVANAITNKDISDTVIKQMGELISRDAIQFPKNYSYGNNLKLAYLKISQSVDLFGVDKNSVAQALIQMVCQGLDISKNQCYFIKYGNKLNMMRSYFGDIAVLERVGLIVPGSTKATCVYQGDNLITKTIDGEEIVCEHSYTTNPLERHDLPIVGAYAVTTLLDGSKRYSIMSMSEIKKSWSKSKAAATSSTHKDFASEMCKRTVIRRLTKYVAQSSATIDGLSDEQKTILYNFNRSTEEEYVNNDFKPLEASRKSNIAIPDLDEYVPDEFEQESAPVEIDSLSEDIEESEGKL